MRVRWSGWIGALACLGCDVGAVPDVDGGWIEDCAAAPAGAACGPASVCVDGECVDSVCGDGLVGPDEQCDDGNAVALDGCEPAACVHTCTGDAACSDGEPCDGEERCTEDHVCAAGDALAREASCVAGVVGRGACADTAQGLRCVPLGCGDGALDAGEECDDGRNGDDRDGCTDMCRWTCTTDAMCDDHDVCTGAEVCELATHRCAGGTPLDCRDASDCTRDLCDPIDGCVFPRIDADGDGRAPAVIAGCGDDCDDARDDVHPGAQELCDGIDHDCDGDPQPAAPPYWYADCDGDGYAPVSAVGTRVQSCEEPYAVEGCLGGWTTRAPAQLGSGEFDRATWDCDESDPAIHPGAAETAGDGVDEDCDARERCYVDSDDDGYREPSGAVRRSDDADCADPGEAMEREPAGDCCDADSRAHPEQPGFYVMANSCGSFDYNCEAGVEPAFRGTGMCAGVRASCALAAAGWNEETPGCGALGGWVESCVAESAPDACVANAAARQQSCR